MRVPDFNESYSFSMRFFSFLSVLKSWKSLLDAALQSESFGNYLRNI